MDQQEQIQGAPSARHPNFTPGPWYADGPAFTHVRAKELEYESVKGATARPAVAQLLKYVPREQRIANAHLIAAAPDLYAALCDLVGAVNRPDLPQERAARAALAKAETGNA